MIYDRLENFDTYAALFPEEWAKVKEFFSSGVIPEPGKYELMPDGKLFVNIQKYAPHVYQEERLEYHRQYIDIQLLLLGREKIICSALDGLDEVTPYSEENDCGFARLEEGRGTVLDLSVGNFAVLFPEEGHEPCVGDPGTSVIKAVVKLRVG